MDLKARDISMSLCSLLDSCSAKRHNNKLRKMDILLKMLDLILPKTGFKLSRK